ncbi:MAG: hypothetical protein ABGX16_02850 [Pirellulales bacterium]
MNLKLTPGRILAVVIGILMLAIVAGILFPAEYTAGRTVERLFAIDKDFTKVRKIMVRTNAAKEIVTMGGDSEFIEQQWEDGNAQFEGEKIGPAILRSVLSEDPGWKLELKGTLKVRTLSETIGHEVIELQQEVKIDPNSLQSQVKLKQGTERLLDYSMSTSLVRAEDHTRVELKLTQKIKIEVPWFAHSIADRRTLAAIVQSLTNQELAIRQLIEENADKAGLFPLR